MKLLTHRMAGFNHLSGTFSLNFGELPGLVAITGGNGQGKTSLALEGPLAGLFGPGATTKAFASREGNLARYATSKAAFIEDTWELASGIYRVRVNVDGERRTTDAALTQLLPDGTQVPMNDGKSSTFKEAVAQLFPTQRSLLAGPFAGQTRRGSFGELGQKERMELFVELADLAYLEKHATTARRCAQVATAVVDRLRVAMATLRQAVQDADPVLVVNRLAEIEQLMASQQQLKDGAEQLLALAIADRDRLQADAQKHAAAAALVTAAQQAVATARVRLEQLDTTTAKDIHKRAYVTADRRRDDALAANVARGKQLQADYDKALADRNERIKNNEALLADRATIEKALADATVAEADIARYEAQEVTLRAELDRARENGTEARRQLYDARQAAVDLDGYGKRAELLTKVKFGDDCGVAPACPLVTDAVAARAKLPDLQLKAAPIPELSEAASHWDAEVAKHSAAIEAAQVAARKARGTLAACKRESARAAHLQVADQRIAEYRRDQSAATEAFAVAMLALDRETEQVHEARRVETLAADEAFNAAMAATEERRKQLQSELDGLTADAARKAKEAEGLAGYAPLLSTAVTAVNEAQAAISLADRQLASLATERDGLQGRQAALTKLHARNTELERRHRLAEDALLAWNALAQRLGRDGLQRLEIDAAGPVVSDIANQLLEVGWGPRFTVAIVTQVATADGKDMKEKFTIEVLDNLHGGEPRDIGDLSGGERVVVEEAIRAALACYCNRRIQGTGSRTIWRDEADGGLDDEKGERYVQMLRKMRELSGAEQVVFITHRPELAAMADTVVRVADGAVQSITRSAA